MTMLAAALTSAWVLFCLVFFAIGVPMAALGPFADRRSRLLNVGPTLACSWLTIAISVPLAASVHGFNWVTALVIAGICPVGLWLARHRGTCSIAFRHTVRSLIFRALTLRAVRLPQFTVREWIVPLAGLSALLAWPFVTGRSDVRLPVPADFDTLWRTRQILSGAATVLDPLASLAAVVTRIAAANPLHVAGAIRLALVVLTGLAAGMLVAEVCGRLWTIPAVAGAIPVGVFVPWAPAATWAFTFAMLVGVTSLYIWIRDCRPRDGWYALAAFVLAASLLLPFIGNLDMLVRVSSTAQYLEHSAAAEQALQLDRSPADSDWLLVAPPEQQLEVGKGRFYDLARFVSRFRGRTGDPNFRFDLGVERIYVFIEERPVDPGFAAVGVRFVAAQPAAYQVPRERFRLGQLAREICDDYARSHARTAIRYDDGELRVYQIDR
ncbi:MAG: hypothetical protein DMF98_13215 [Acidobacteria bacterium]|nr:MAG: hypothetical protein DMF98_13215 [Acidobacteriota bacterium]